MPQNICTTHAVCPRGQQAGKAAGRFPGGALGSIHRHDTAAHFCGDEDLVAFGKAVGQCGQVGGVGRQCLHIAEPCARQFLRKGALAAVQRPGDEDHNSPPHWQAHSAASIQSSAFCKNHPARSPVMPPNCALLTLW